MSGYYDGSFIWGRGSSDCGNTLIGTLEAASLLLEKSFVPTRTILFAFGFDEESKGLEGAGHIAVVLKERFGKDGIEFMVDEGGLGVGEMYGAGFASPSTSEKGQPLRIRTVRTSLIQIGQVTSMSNSHSRRQEAIPAFLQCVYFFSFSIESKPIFFPASHRHRNDVANHHRARIFPLFAFHLPRFARLQPPTVRC